MKIVLLGSGNVATHLGKALSAAGHEIIQVWSRTLDNAKVLAESLKSDFINDLSGVNPNAELYLIAVSDDAIPQVAANLPFNDKILAHTSGTSELDIPGISGVFYPLQTFSKQKRVNFSIIPVAIEANSPAVADMLEHLAKSISSKVIQLNSEQRKALHIAAVFACNFSNHLYAIADTILRANNLEFDLIKPLITETAEKVQVNIPESVQTGPAVRNDKMTMNKHFEFLKNDVLLQEIYEKLSKSIINLSDRA